MQSDAYAQMLAVVGTVLKPTVLIGFAGVLLSTIMSYIPPAAEWFAGKGKGYKPVFLLVIITLVVVAIGVLSFTGVMVLVPASTEGILLLVFDWGVAAVTCGQTYQYSPQTQKVLEIKAARPK